MSVFTSTRELDTQQQTRNFKVQTGWKRHAMALAGYKASGEKNWWGKWVGATPIAKNIAGKHLAEGSDAEEVIASQTGAELKHQMGTASFAASFVGGGGGSDFMGGSGGASAASGAGGSATGSSGGGLASKFGQGTGGAAGQGTVAGNTMNQYLGGSGGANSLQSTFQKGISGLDKAGSTRFSEEWKAKERVKTKKEMDKEIDELTDEEVLAMGGVEGDEYVNFEGDTNRQAEGTSNISGAPKTSSEAKGWKEASDYKGMGSHGLAGQFTNLYAEKMAIADAHKAKAQSMFNQKQKSAGSGYSS